VTIAERNEVNKHMTKNQKRILAVIAIVFVAFTVIAFALPFNKNEIFWLSYIFAIISIFAQIYVLKVAFDGAYSAKSKVYGFPIAQIGVIYMCVQLVSSIIFMTQYSVAPIWLAVVIYVLLLALACIGFISTDLVRDEVVRQEVKLETNVSCMTTLRSIVYPLADMCSDMKAKKALHDLADEFRYSDPVSSEALKDIESELENQVGELQSAVTEGNVEYIILFSKKIKTTLTERNRLCKLGKGK
jgi:signal transduction histidine kinase